MTEREWNIITVKNLDMIAMNNLGYVWDELANKGAPLEPTFKIPPEIIVKPGYEIDYGFCCGTGNLIFRWRELPI